MTDTVVLVLAPVGDPRLAMLSPRPAGVRFKIGERFEDFGEDLRRAEALLVWNKGRDALDPVLERAPRLRWVHSNMAGVDHLLSPALHSSPAVLTNSRGIFSASLAEFVLAAVLYFAKGFPRMRRAQQAGRWEPFEVEMIRGATLGIIGYGDIGRAAARLAHAAGMRVVVQRRRPEPSGDDAVVSAAHARLEPVLDAADDLLLATPLTPETYHLIGGAELGRLRPTAVLINVGRGAVVDEGALIHALQRGALRGAALDVFEREPLPESHPFYGMDNVLLSPHCADRVAGWLEQAMELFLENLARFIGGEPPRNIVDKQLGY